MRALCTVQGCGSGDNADASTSPRVEGLGATGCGGESHGRPGVEGSDGTSPVTGTASCPSVEGSGFDAVGDTSVLEAEASASNPAVPVIHRDKGHQVVRVTAAAAASTFFACLYTERGDDIFLVLASTALALLGTWLAEQHLGLKGGR